MTIEDNKRLAREAFEVFAGGDFGRLEGFVAPDAVIHQCGFLEPLPIRALLQRASWDQGPVRDRASRLEQVVAEGDTVALLWRTTGHYADAESPKVNGAPVSFSSMMFVRFEDGRIAEVWNIRDTSTLETELWEAAAGRTS